MVKAVRVAIFTHCHVLVAMHDLYLPVISVEPQNGFGSGCFQAGYQVGGLCFDLCGVACPDMLAIADTRTSGFLVKSIFYSAPSQLIGQRLRVHIYDNRIEAFLGGTLVVSHSRARRRGDGHRVHVINYHHVIHALRRKPQALWSSIYRDSLFPRTEYAEAWKVLQRDLPRRDACRRMVDLLFIAHEQGCEAELALLLSADIDAHRVPDPKALAARLMPRPLALPRDVPVAHPTLDSFDALLGASA